MLVRLAFAVMIQVDADILLIDEVLAVGDAAFQQKCFDEFVRIREAGKTILLVTHDMGAVHRFCDRAMLLERGRVVELGEPDDVGNRYLELNFSEAARNDAAAERDLGSTDRMGDGTRRDPRGVVRGRDGRARRDDRRPAAAARSPPACASTPTSTTRCSALVLQNDRKRHRARRLEPVVEPDAGPLRRRARGRPTA